MNIKLGYLRTTALTIASLAPIGAVRAQAPPESPPSIQRQIATEREAIMLQQRTLDAQLVRLQALEAKLLGSLRGTGAPPTTVAGGPGDIPLPPSPPPVGGAEGAVPTVGEAPSDQRQVQVAVLADQGGIITRAGRLTLEADLEFARADRNRVVFRGVAIPEAVLIGAFDINESRQNVLTAAAVARLGLSSRLEINARIPYVRRSDNSALAPIVNNGNGGAVGTDRSVTNGNLGDVDFGIRYQFTDGRNGSPYLIAGVQAIAPSGTDPFTVPRDTLGNPLKAATGAGFWGISPSLTAILPTDPAVLFATIGYTYNIGRNINRRIGSALLNRVSPGGTPSASLGIAISLNPRTSLSLGYAHTLALGTKTVLQAIDAQDGALSDRMRVKTRDLQLGRLLFGVSYRTGPSTTINWNVEIGATDDATDLRTTLRIPLSFNLF
jgi:hypothetical protein